MTLPLAPKTTLTGQTFTGEAPFPGVDEPEVARLGGSAKLPTAAEPTTVPAAE